MLKNLFNYYKTDKYKVFIIFGIKISLKNRANNSISNTTNNEYLLKKNIILNENLLNINKQILIMKLKNILNDKMLELFFINDNKILYIEIVRIWTRYIVTDDFINLMYFISKRDNIWEKIDPNFWLIYISSLCEVNNFDTAEYILYKYINKYNLRNIHRFFYVVKLCEQFGIINDDIRKSLSVINIIDRSIDNKIFEKIIKNKSIAVVGNGPQELGKEKGKEIDSHDIVIRFNNFTIDNYEKDYGSKTDIWVKNGDPIIGNISKDFNELFCWLPDLYHTIVGDHIIKSFSVNDKITYFNNDMQYEIKKYIGGVFPTAGIVSIYNIYKIKKLNNEEFNINNIYGFSFKNNDFSISNYHYDHSNAKDKNKLEEEYKTSHNINKEITFLRKLFNLGCQ